MNLNQIKDLNGMYPATVYGMTPGERLRVDIWPSRDTRPSELSMSDRARRR